MLFYLVYTRYIRLGLHELNETNDENIQHKLNLQKKKQKNCIFALHYSCYNLKEAKSSGIEWKLYFATMLERNHLRNSLIFQTHFKNSYRNLQNAKQSQQPYPFAVCTGFWVSFFFFLCIVSSNFCEQHFEAIIIHSAKKIKYNRIITQHLQLGRNT